MTKMTIIICFFRFLSLSDIIKLYQAFIKFIVNYFLFFLPPSFLHFDIKPKWNKIEKEREKIEIWEKLIARVAIYNYKPLRKKTLSFFSLCKKNAKTIFSIVVKFQLIRLFRLLENKLFVKKKLFILFSKP